MTASRRASSPKHFLDLDRFDRATLRHILDTAKALKAGAHDWGPEPLGGQHLALVFEKPSTRTRVSFEVGVRQLGGRPIVLEPSGTQPGRGETIADTARVLSRYVDAVMLRTTSEANLTALAEHASIPVINGLTDRTHPCQLMADVLTVEEHLGGIAGRTIAWCGDGNNMAVSWLHAAARFGFGLRLACPAGREPPAETVAWARREGADVCVTPDVAEAVTGADVVVTDIWVSMGADPGEVEQRHAELRGYRVDAEVMARVAPHAIFMHCLPAHRGEEVTAEVIDGPRSVVWDEAENRLHAQKGILLWCLT